MVGHATFCVVVVYNNVLARLRRTPGSLVEASLDLGASPLVTFRRIVLPALATALVAGGMLAFALSFDEVIVTTFTAGQQETLPIWIFSQLTRPRQRPVTNVVALFVVAATALPILAGPPPDARALAAPRAARRALARGAAGSARRRGQPDGARSFRALRGLERLRR